MLKTIDPANISIRPFKVYKQFSVTQADSASGVFGIEGITGSLYNFNVATTPSRSFTKLTAPYSQSFFKYPVYKQINRLYYDNPVPYLSFGSNDTLTSKRELHNKVNVITIPQELYGEQIKPNSVTITDNSLASTLTLKDDGYGNLYDYAFSSSYAAGTPDVNYSGSQVGNIFYSHGVITITDTGSYSQVGLGDGTDGYEVDFQSTHTIYEHEYGCILEEGEFNRSLNISTTIGYSGSITVLEGSPKASNLFPPGNSPGVKQIDPSKNELALQAFYSQSYGYAPIHNGIAGSNLYNGFTHEIGELDPFGTTRFPVFKNELQLMVGNSEGVDIGTLYKDNTYTFSIYLKWSGSLEHQDHPGFEFDLADTGQNGRNAGSYVTKVNNVIFTDNIVNNITTSWKRFSITAKHISDIKHHHIQVGEWFGKGANGSNGYFMWSCPQIEIGEIMTPFVNDPLPIPTPIVPPPPTMEYHLVGQVTGSSWAPYITTIGLYDDFGQLVALGKLSRAVRNDPEIAYNITVRFDA